MRQFTIEIDDQEIEVSEDMTVLDAAAAAGIGIPSLCFSRRHGACNACMVCGVREVDKDIIPACSTKVRSSMRIDASSPEVRAFRKHALEFLLAEHVGDCDAPCRLSCPVFFDIPAMLHKIAANDFPGAADLIHDGMPLPHLSCMLCKRRPCEKACRRGRHDTPLDIVAILHAALRTKDFPPENQPRKYSVAVVGGGCAGLAASDMLSKHDCRCTVFESGDKPGLEIAGLLAPEYSGLLENELARLAAAGITFRCSAKITPEDVAGWLLKEFDAVLLCVGSHSMNIFSSLLKTDENGAFTRLQSFMTSVKGVFAAEDMAIHASGIQAVADGVESGHAVISWLEHGRHFVAENRYDHRFGEVTAEDMRQFTDGTNSIKTAVTDNAGAGLEAARCLHCDCRKYESCLLRRHASEYMTQQFRIPSQRHAFKRIDAGEIIYEPGKCIRCGICIKIGEAEGKAVGPVFNGRGYEVELGAPLGHSMMEALEGIGPECAAACPTGALSIKIEKSGAGSQNKDKSEKL